jgi:hypothetical protein
VEATRELPVAEQLGEPRVWGERGERVVKTTHVYADGAPVRILVRKRGRRYGLDDRGEAVAKARAVGAPSGWLELAERAVTLEGFNVNRRGVVFVDVVEGRDLVQLVQRLAACAYAVHAELVGSASR